MSTAPQGINNTRGSYCSTGGDTDRIKRLCGVPALVLSLLPLKFPLLQTELRQERDDYVRKWRAWLCAAGEFLFYDSFRRPSGTHVRKAVCSRTLSKVISCNGIVEHVWQITKFSGQLGQVRFRYCALFFALAYLNCLLINSFLDRQKTKQNRKDLQGNQIIIINKESKLDLDIFK